MGNVRDYSPGVVDMIPDGIIAIFIEQLINELGTTGLLVMGLYLFLGRPLRSISKTLREIDDEIDVLINIARTQAPKGKSTGQLF